MNQTADPHRVEIYDTTLRDGAQGEGVSFSLVDKIKIAQQLDSLGVDYIEGGFPLSNPKDQAFFSQIADVELAHAKVCAFGMTRRQSLKPQDDPGINALVNANAPVITIVGKTWDLHVDQVLRVSREENLDMIRQSLGYCLQAATGDGHQVFYDAEHFFDGYRANRDYAMQTLLAALQGGASRLILCDTNGGSLPSWITQVVTEVLAELVKAHPDFADPTNLANRGLGIHCHNDSGLAVANSLAGVQAGAIQVQGTINGIGERCGNVDLTTVVANLQLKMGHPCLGPDSLARLTETSRFVYETANLNQLSNQPFVGAAAFAHKGGMHVHAVQRVPHSYEHVQPDQVGNSRRVLIGELSGASNIAATVGQKFDITNNKQLQRQVLKRVQDLENLGYQFEAATASFELLLHEALGTRPAYWDLDHYRCVILKRGSQSPVTEATVKLKIGDQNTHQVAEGDGPVNALDAALRKCLDAAYPQLANVHLRDYKVRVVNPTAESAAKVRVVAEFVVSQPENAPPPESPEQPCPTPRYFSTIGVNENIVDASWQAITEAFTYHLIEQKVLPSTAAKPK